MKIFNTFILILSMLLMFTLTGCNKTNDELVFEEVTTFSEDLAFIKLNYKYGCINTNG